jgi:diketogulonate reductase-like aldo/keto reductase
MKRSLTLNSGAEMPIIGLGTYKVNKNALLLYIFISTL